MKPARNFSPERTVPSAESGGVPDPTPQYIAQAALPSIILPEPRPILVVLDLNGTLLYRAFRNRAKYIARPHAEPFLAYSASRFRLVIWSSAQPRNVVTMCSRLLTPEARQSVVAIWARDKFGLTRDDYTARTQCYKRLSLLWNDAQIAASHPLAASGGRWDQTNTVLVDDSVEKARSEPYNLVEIPEFHGDDAGLGGAEVLPQVHDYLNTLAWRSNISAYIRENKFKLQLTSTTPGPIEAIVPVTQSSDATPLDVSEDPAQIMNNGSDFQQVGDTNETAGDLLDDGAFVIVDEASEIPIDNSKKQ